jgi:hypothetical protein
MWVSQTWIASTTVNKSCCLSRHFSTEYLRDTCCFRHFVLGTQARSTSQWSGDLSPASPFNVTRERLGVLERGTQETRPEPAHPRTQWGVDTTWVRGDASGPTIIWRPLQGCHPYVGRDQGKFFQLFSCTSKFSHLQTTVTITVPEHSEFEANDLKFLASIFHPCWT